MFKTSGAAIVAVSLMCGACGGPAKGPKPQDGKAVGTSGRSKHGTVALDGAQPVFVSPDRDGTRLWTLTKQFYQKRDNTLAWIDGNTPRRQMDELIQVLQHTDKDGLDPALYNASTLTERRTEAGRGFFLKKGFTADEAAALDVWLTYLYLQYASDVTSGVANLSHADNSWQVPEKKWDAVATLEQALDQNQVKRSLEELTPRHPQYIALRAAFAKYQGIAAHGGWKPVPAQLKLKPGQRSPAVPALRERLAVTDDLGSARPEGDVYGPELQEAVKRFQRRHGLEPDGAISAATVRELNVPVAARIAQIALNLERWRWLPADLGDRHILVNIPEYRLEVWDRGRVPLSMRVVVGKKDTPTPIFNDQMTHLVFAPYWNVPADIVKNETVPQALKDPAFLQRTNMEVLDRGGNSIDPATIDMDNVAAYRFRQRPGASNSLGLVKFMFPNQFNVYLHDTPADSLFARTTRSFSHGCVRLEEPARLAEYVLADQPAWTPDRIAEAMRGNQETTVKLNQRLPVYLGYWTARVSADGILQFRSDLYGVDGRQTALLTTALQKLKTRAAAAAAAARRGVTTPAASRAGAAPAVAALAPHHP